MNVLKFPARCLTALMLAALLAGCATAKIDWSSRVGHCTFDEAIVEFGPPDNQARLTDGVLVAEWLTRRGYHHIHSIGGYYGSPYYNLPYPPTYLDSYSPDYYLRLTFGSDGRLQSWKKLSK